MEYMIYSSKYEALFKTLLLYPGELVVRNALEI